MIPWLLAVLLTPLGGFLCPDRGPCAVAPIPYQAFALDPHREEAWLGTAPPEILVIRDGKAWARLICGQRYRRDNSEILMCNAYWEGRR